MAIALVGSPTLFEQASGTSITLTLPTGLSTGNVLIAYVGSTGVAPTPPAGWTPFGNNVESTTPLSSFPCYRVVDGTETTTYTWTALTGSTRSTGVIQAFSGVNTTTPIDVTPAKATLVADGTTTPPMVVASVTTTGTNAWLLTGAVMNAATAATLTVPGGFTLISSSTGTGRGLKLAYQVFTAGGTAPSVSWTYVPTAPTLQAAGFQTALRSASSAAVATQTVHWVGAPTASGFTVSSRTTGAASVRVKAGTNAAVTAGVVFGASVTPDADGYAKPLITGLAPLTQYWYDVEITDPSAVVTLAGQIGSCRTLPTAGAATSFSFGYGSCMGSGSTSNTALSGILARNPAFFAHLGDLHYADDDTSSQASHRGELEAQYATNSSLRAIVGGVASYYIKSDHDAGGGNDGDPGVWTAPNRLATLQFTPYPPLVDSGLGLYFSVVYGRVRFIFTDTRYLRTVGSAVDDASKSILGTAQKVWFKSQLTQPEPFKVWFQDATWVSSNITNDTWMNYNTERLELGAYITANMAAIGKLVTLHGDQHMIAMDDGTDNAWGGFVSACAAPFDQTASLQKGVFSQGLYPGVTGAQVQQYGYVVVTDTGSDITFTITGYDGGGVARQTQTVQVSTVHNRARFGAHL